MTTRYVTVDSLRMFKVAGAVVDFSGYNDNDLDELIQVAEYVVDTYTGGRFDLFEDEERTFNGSGSQNIYFSQRVCGVGLFSNLKENLFEHRHW